MRLRIATYNLENFDDERPLSLEERLPVLRRYLDRLGADILCLQEVNAQEPPKRPRTLAALERLVAGTPYAGFHRAGTTSDGGDYPRDIHNLVVLSRHPIGAVEQVAHSLVPPIAWRWLDAERSQPVRFERPVLSVVIDVGQPLHLLNLHLRAPLAVAVPGGKAGPFAWKTVPAWAEGYFLAGVKRQAQALEARLLVDAILDRDRDAWIVVAGDLNAEEREVPLTILTAPLDATGNPALAGRTLARLSDRVPAERRYTVRHGRGLLLDHLLVSRPLAERCTAVEILNSGLADEVEAANAGFDDPAGFHAPMVAEFNAG